MQTAAELCEEQIRAVELARTKRISIVSGPPGSGKTRLISALCALRPKTTLLLAPTGTAAERITASTGIRAFVIAKALHDKNLEALQNRDVVIDEAGMTSTDTLQRVFTFLKPKTLVLIGDAKQLPCVEGVSALSSLMRVDRAPRTLLTQLWRRSGKPTSALDRCLRTLGTPQFDLSDQDDSFRVVECVSQDNCCARAAKDYALRPSQMLGYTNAVVQRLNALTEDKSRPIVRGAARMGDRVVCVENAYGGEPRRLLVANGACGTCTPKGVEYDNGHVDKKFKLTSFMPCRAMTVNKSQGNEYEVHGLVVVAAWAGGPPPLELLYTALSRFKSSVTVYVHCNATRSVFALSQFKVRVDEDLVAQLAPR